MVCESSSSTRRGGSINQPDTKFNNITVFFDGLHHYASFNIETYLPEQLELSEKHIDCDINSNKNGWLVTSNGQKEFFDVDHEDQMIKHINKLMSKCQKTLDRDIKAAINILNR